MQKIKDLLHKCAVYSNSSKLACRIASSRSGASDIWFALRERRIAVQNTKMKDTRAGGGGDDSMPIAMSRWFIRLPGINQARPARTRLGSWYFAIRKSGPPRVVIAEGCNSPWCASRSVSYKSKSGFWNEGDAAILRSTEARSRYPFPVAIRISERSWKIFANTVIFPALESAARIWVSILNFSPRRSHAISGYL